MKRFFSAASLLFLCWLLGVAPAGHAQTPAMSLMGSVQNDEQQPLPGAAITVIHLPSGARHAVASDGDGRFTVANLLTGGPYLIRVGEGGYRPQTVENIFLETGKTATFTVTLSKLGAGKPGAGKDRNTRPAKDAGPALALAPEAVVGGPVLITTLSAPPAAPAHSATAATVLPPPPAAVDAKPAAATAAPSAAPKPRYVRRTAAKPVADPIVPGHYDAKTGNYLYDTGQLTTLKMPGGGTLAGVGINSTEGYLHRFLTDPNTQVDTVNLTNGWYNFDKVFFNTGKATLTTESLGQLRNIVTILRAYPTARLKLGGYTDNTGDYKVNRQLSEARARTAWASLVEMGISPSRLEARGYGPNYAIADNETDEGRAKNRRLSLRVLHK